MHKANDGVIGKRQGFNPRHRKIPKDRGAGWDAIPASYWDSKPKKKAKRKPKYGGGAAAIGGAT